MKRPSIRTLLLGANAVVVGLPLLALAVLRTYDVYLLRQTERQLLAESVVVGEIFREAYRRERGESEPAEHRPPGRRNEVYSPVEAIIDLDVEVLPAQPPELPPCPPRGADEAALTAGRSIEPLLQRAQTFNLSAVRVIDARGCVVATTRSESGLLMIGLPEVRSALGGRYLAVARERISDEPLPPIGDVRRRGSVRVFTALPVFSDGRVIAVVRASRTGLDALTSLWANRRGLLLWGLSFGAVATLVSIGFSFAIARPLRKLTAQARAIAQGTGEEQLTASGMAPAEVAVLAQVLQGMTERLRERAAYVAEFANHASHELKTPITAMRGAAELLQQSWQEMDATQRQRFIDNIVLDAERMERLVRGLLELAQIENAAPETLEPIALEPFVRQVLAPYGDAVSLALREPPETVAIREAHLYCVLSNLVDNAVRHGAGRPVEVTLRGQGGRLRLEVRDRGPGISEANQRRLFQRFFTTERDRGGTGLGLAMVKAIAEARGGVVSVQSGVTGSTFSVTL